MSPSFVIRAAADAAFRDGRCNHERSVLRPVDGKPPGGHQGVEVLVHGSSGLMPVWLMIIGTLVRYGGRSSMWSSLTGLTGMIVYSNSPSRSRDRPGVEGHVTELG